jgi:hypothetical protein
LAVFSLPTADVAAPAVDVVVLAQDEVALDRTSADDWFALHWIRAYPYGSNLLYSFRRMRE